MKSVVLTRYKLVTSLAAALLAGCGGSQPAILAPNAMPRAAVSVPQTHRHAAGIPSPILASGIYVSENRDRRAGVFAYPTDNRMNRGPICRVSAQPTYNVAVDNAGNLIVPNSDGTISVFQGPDMCGPKLGSFRTLFGFDYPVDVTSQDAVNGTIAVGIEQVGGSGEGIIELCTLKGNCTTTLMGGGDFLFAVAMSKEGNCWASSAQPTTLTYFAGCSGYGQPATGYENSDAGGLDIDNHGNLVSMSCSPASCSTPTLYVYSGCNPTCKKLGGPFTLHGRSVYGHLNGKNTRFAAADDRGQIDIYRYTPTSLTYLYSFGRGLSAGSRLGVAYNPRSKE